jgi:hypothetical protein
MPKKAPQSYEELIRSHKKLQRYRAPSGGLWDSGRIRSGYGLQPGEFHALLKQLGLSMHEIASPGSPRHQEALGVMVEGLALELVLKAGDFKRWLRAPNAEFGQRAPLEVMLSRPNGLELLANLAHDVLTGQPG